MCLNRGHLWSIVLYRNMWWHIYRYYITKHTTSFIQTDGGAVVTWNPYNTHLQEVQSNKINLSCIQTVYQVGFLPLFSIKPSDCGTKRHLAPPTLRRCCSIRFLLKVLDYRLFKRTNELFLRNVNVLLICFLYRSSKYSSLQLSTYVNVNLPPFFPL